MFWKRANGSIRGTALAAALGVLSSVLVAGGDPVFSATTSTATFYATGDAYVSTKYPAKNFGSQSVVRVDASPSERSYVRFSLANLTGTVSRATLRLYARDSHSRGFDVAAAASTWGDRTITWNNAPAVGPVVASSGPTAAGKWLSIDVTPLVVGNGGVSVALTTTSSSALRLASKESGGNGPRLVVETTDSSTTTTTTAPAPSGDPVLVAAGDIACPTTASGYNGGLGTASACRQKATSDLVLSLDPDALASLGDQQYDVGALEQFQAAYGPAWGRLKNITRPAAGNHEYQGDSTASGYFTYFGTAAGSAGKGYYSYDLGSWHIVVLNSNCSQVGGCGAGSPQETWLRADLAAHPAECTLAYWHHPRFSSGQHGNVAAVDPFWRALYEAGADVVLSGHDHHYERFAPQNPSGQADPAAGIRQFVVGTGGRSHYGISALKANSEKRGTGTFGVLGLTLHDGSYDWRFVPEAGKSFTDSGTASCH
jgi:acid phosphatase type 7